MPNHLFSTRNEPDDPHDHTYRNFRKVHVRLSYKFDSVYNPTLTSNQHGYYYLQNCRYAVRFCFEGNRIHAELKFK